MLNNELTFTHLGTYKNGQSVNLSGYREFTARPHTGDIMLPVMPVHNSTKTVQFSYDSYSIYFIISTDNVLTIYTDDNQGCRINARWHWSVY